MRTVGLHLRVQSTFLQMVERARVLGLQTLQCFFLYQDSGKAIKFSQSDIDSFLQQRNYFNDLFLHGSYWINLSGKHCDLAEKTLKKELDLAKRLQFTHLILHPGTATGEKSKEDGIDSLVRILNSFLKTESEVQFVLENTAHGGRSIGSDINDFKVILEKLDYPEKLSFCIDTAHAHAYGYDLVTNIGKKQFIRMIDEIVGLKKIAVIHLNDTNEKQGEKQDRHEIPGNGSIGEHALRAFVSHDILRLVPLILELPMIDDTEQKLILQKIQQWFVIEKC